MRRTACFNGHLYQAGGGCPVGYSGRGRHPPGPRCRHLPDPEADTLPGPRRRHPPRPRGRHHRPVNDRCKNMHSSRMRRTACFNGHLYQGAGVEGMCLGVSRGRCVCPGGRVYTPLDPEVNTHPPRPTGRRILPDPETDTPQNPEADTPPPQTSFAGGL